MPRTSYQDELATLRGEVGAMADLALDRYWEATEVLASGDPQQAQRIVDGDAELNDWYLDIERECIDLIARLAGEMVDDAMAAYTTEDADTARLVAAPDEQLDEQCKRASETIVRNLMTTGVGADPVELRLQRVSRLLVTIRDLERVGDHAVNISARTQYMIENDDDLIY